MVASVALLRSEGDSRRNNRICVCFARVDGLILPLATIKINCTTPHALDHRQTREQLNIISWKTNGASGPG